VSSKHISLLVCALFTLATSAGAQFTAAVVPPRTKSKVDSTAMQDSVRRATVALAARVTDMKKWVDSAAGVSVPAADSTTSKADSKTSKKGSAATPLTKDSVVMTRNARVRADSAAAIMTVEVHDSSGLKGTDSAKAVPPTSSRDSSAGTKRFANGAPAPATASLLPLLALAGLSTLLAGAALRR
jgi:hypothetical protein